MSSDGAPELSRRWKSIPRAARGATYGAIALRNLAAKVREDVRPEFKVRAQAVPLKYRLRLKRERNCVSAHDGIPEMQVVASSPGSGKRTSEHDADNSDAEDDSPLHGGGA